MFAHVLKNAFCLAQRIGAARMPIGPNKKARKRGGWGAETYRRPGRRPGPGF